MMRVRIKELALIAVAGGLLAFEAMGLNGLLPTAMQALADRGAVGQVKAASLDAELAPAPVLAEAGSAAAFAAARAAKGAARLLGTVTPPRHAMRSVLVVSHEGGRNAPARVRVVSMTDETCRAIGIACPSIHRTYEVRRAAETTARRSTL
jgi:hypothetical protein